MAIIFSDDFNSGNFSRWDFVAVENNFGNFGCAGTKCYSCGNNNSLGIAKIFPTLQVNNTFRSHFAYLASGPVPSSAKLLTISDNGGGGHRMLDILIYPDGHISLVTFPEIRDSSAGLIPVDGTWIAIQVTLHVYTMPRPDFTPWINNVGDIQIVVNNTLIWSQIAVVFSGLNYTSDPLPTGWQGCYLLAPQTFSGSTFSSLVAYDNFEIEDSVLIKTFDPCVAIPPKLFVGSCSYVPVAELSGVYFINPTNTHDVYNTSENKIPDPTIRTAGIGE